MMIDCDSCVMRDIACSDCVVSTLLSFPILSDAPESGEGVHRTDTELTYALVSDETVDAISLLASRGIVRPMRYKRAVQG